MKDMMITTADKLNVLTGVFCLFSVLIFLLIALSWFRKKRLSFFSKTAIVIVLAGMAALVDAYWIEPNWIEVQEVVIHDSVLAEVLEGIKVIQISDIHLRGGIGYRENELVRKVNALRPDLLFITGDFFSDQYKKELPIEVKALTELIRGFKATSGIFGVRGNYDGPLSNPAILKEFKASGIDVLINENRTVPLPNHKILCLVGLHYPYSQRSKFQAFGGIPQGTPVILLAHEPDSFGEAKEAGVNLLLVGHTHGGQIGIPFLISKSNSANKSPFMSGLFDKGKTKMYVNRGIGTTHIPVRFFCRPEIAVITVKP
jgi:uncharacterized protein